VDGNLEAGIEFAQHRFFEDRVDVATTCATRLALSMSMLIDGMGNAADKAFNAWPERIYAISTEGRVLYQGGKGPYGFDSGELETFLHEMREPEHPVSSG
jgi:hypothetical protein